MMEPSVASEEARPVIQRLPPDVVNKIAAGEVVQRPANALKELIENSLDAGSKNITIITKEGGLKLLQITDDGCGISKEDLPKLCHRHTTSKLKSFEDLSRIQTFGFRGEALSSIALISHTSITSCPPAQDCAYRAKFEEGKIVGEPRPVAGNKGTQITVEDLFYNNPTRRKGLRSGADEHNFIADVVRAYAMHNPHCSFVLKKHGESIADVRTVVPSSSPSSSASSSASSSSASPSVDVRSSLKQLFGVSLDQHLLTFRTESDGCIFEGCVTGKGYVGPRSKPQYYIFVNKRWVEMQSIKRAVREAYINVFGTKGAPFALISITIPAQEMDVNVHPSKEVVHFARELERIEDLKRCITEVLKASDILAEGDGAKVAAPSTPKPTPPKAAAANKAAAGVSSPPVPSAVKSKPKQAAITAFTETAPATTAAPQKRKSGEAEKEEEERVGAGEEGGDPDELDFAPTPPSKVAKQQKLDSVIVSKPKEKIVMAVDDGEEEGDQMGGEEESVVFNIANEEDDAPGEVEGGGKQKEIRKAKAKPKPKEKVSPAKSAEGSKKKQKLIDEEVDEEPLQVPATTKSIVEQKAAKGKEKDFKKLPNPAAVEEVSLEPETFPSRTDPQKRFQLSELTSIRNLLTKEETAKQQAMKMLLQKAQVVGGVCDSHLLVFHDGNLWLLEDYPLSKSMCYQWILRKFGQFSRISIQEPLPLRETILLGLAQPESGYASSSSSLASASQQQRASVKSQEEKKVAAEQLAAILESKALMLDDYFAVKIEDGCLVSLPAVFDQHLPHPTDLPLFLVQLAQVNYAEEQPCFEQVSRTLAELFAVKPRHSQVMIFDGKARESNDEDEEEEIPPQHSTQTESQISKDSPPLRELAVFSQRLFVHAGIGDHPLQRALHQAASKREHVFARPYSGTARCYVVDEPARFFRVYHSLPPAQRLFEDIVRADTPVKFFADLECDLIKFDENKSLEAKVKEMMAEMKKAVAELWMEDTESSEFPNDGWLEFDASIDRKKVSRHLFNYKISFGDVNHLFSFMKRLEKKILKENEKSLLVAYREKRRKKVKEFFFDMSVYTRNHAFRLPWSSKLMESPLRPLVPVSAVGGPQRGCAPDLETFCNALVNYRTAGNPLEYPSSDLVKRASPKKKSASASSPSTTASSSSASPSSQQLHELTSTDAMTRVIIPELQELKLFAPPKTLSANKQVQKIADSSAWAHMLDSCT